MRTQEQTNIAPCARAGRSCDFTHRVEDGNKRAPERAAALVNRYCRACPFQIRQACKDALDPDSDGGLYAGQWFARQNGNLIELPIPNVN